MNEKELAESIVKKDFYGERSFINKLKKELECQICGKISIESHNTHLSIIVTHEHVFIYEFESANYLIRTNNTPSSLASEVKHRMAEDILKKYFKSIDKPQ